MADSKQASLLSKIAAYTEILAADCQSTIFVSLSESYRKLGLLDDAFSVAQKGLVNLPEYAPGYVVMARIKCQQGDLAGSEASFKKALELDPDSLAALVGFSRLHLLLDNVESARSLLLTARELSPADSVINKLLLTLPEPEIQEDVEADASVSDSVTETEPEPEYQPVSHIEPLETATLAELYLKQGMVEQALGIYRNLLARDPDNLDFRRRIRDIELSIDPTAGTGEIAEPIENKETVASAEPEVAETSEIVELIAPVADKSVLDQLNSLLTSIEKRRGDV